MPEPDMTLLKRLADKAQSGGSGSGGGDVLDQRVAALEADMREVKGSLGRIETALGKLDGRLAGLDDRVRKVEVDVARMDGRLASMPSTWTLVGTCFTMVLSTCGLMFAILRFGTSH